VGFLFIDPLDQKQKRKLKTTNMSATYAEVEFDEGDEFNLPLRFEREAVAEKFAVLKESLLGDFLDDSESIALHNRLKHAANEAAGIAWTTEFPLLVFPALFDELAKREQLRASRQQRIIARTETLLAAIV
jgi:hypothetical protein